MFFSETASGMLSGKKAPGAAAFALGAGSQLTQIILLREFLMVFHGNELSFGVILAFWMAWVGAGGRLGVFISRRSEDPWVSLSLTSLLLAGVLPLTIVLVRLMRGFFEVLPGIQLSFFDMVISCFPVIAPAALLFGIQFVLLSKIWREYGQSQNTSGGAGTYIAEALGSMFGGLLISLVLVPRFGSLQISAFTSIMLISAAFSACKSSSEEALIFEGRKKWKILLIIIASAVIFSLPFLKYIENLTYELQWRMIAPEHSLLEVRQSPHGLITVLKQGDQHSFYQSGHLAFSTATVETVDYQFEEMDAAILAHLVMSQHEKPQSVLMIGGGLRGILREVLRHPVSSVHYVEFDPEMLETAKNYAPISTRNALADPRLAVVSGDGRLFTARTNERFDVILVDVPDPHTSVLNRFYTVEFFCRAAHLLDEYGVMAITAGGGGDLRSAPLANRNASVYHSLRECFSYVLPLSAGSQIVFLAAQNAADLITLPEELVKRFSKGDIEDSAFHPAYFYSLLGDSVQNRMGWLLFHHGRKSDSHITGPQAPPISPPGFRDLIKTDESELPPVRSRYFLNSDMRPIGYFYSLTAWDYITRASRPASFDWMVNARQSWLAIPVLALLLPFVFSAIIGRLRRDEGRKKRISAVRLSVATTGLSTMSMQIAIIFSFQGIYGFVYEMIGVIAAVFMSGLAAGAFVSRRTLFTGSGNKISNNVLKKIIPTCLKKSWTFLALIQAIITLFAFAMSFALPQSASIESFALIFPVFAAITFSAGFISGLTFPVALSCHHEITGRPEMEAGTLYGLDLLGACFGALISGVIVVPMLGIVSCFYLAGIMNATACLILVFSGRCHEEKL